MKENSYKFTVESPSKRTDLLLVEYFEDVGDIFSRNSIQDLIKKGLVKVDGKAIKPSKSLRPGETVEIIIPEQPKLEIMPQFLPIRVVYEDDYLIVINKTPDIVVHPAPGNYQGTLVNPTFKATVLSFNTSTNVIYAINTNGTPTLNQPIFGSSSSTVRPLLGKTGPDFISFSGYLAYIENRSGVQRSSDGIEQFKFVLGY